MRRPRGRARAAGTACPTDPPRRARSCPDAAIVWSSSATTWYLNSIRTGDSIRPSVPTSISSSYRAGRMVLAVRFDHRQRNARDVPFRGSSSRETAAGRRGRPRTRRSSSRSRPPPSYRFRRSAPARRRSTPALAPASAWHVRPRPSASPPRGAPAWRAPGRRSRTWRCRRPGSRPRPSTIRGARSSRRSRRPLRSARAALAVEQLAHGPNLRLATGG